MQKGFILQLVFVCIHSQGYNSNSESSVGFEPIWIQSCSQVLNIRAFQWKFVQCQLS